MFRPCITLTLLLGMVINAVAAEPPAAPEEILGPVSRTPPALYAEKLAALLTPLSSVMAKRGDFPTEGRDGVMLLDETLIWTDAKGGRMIVHHTVEEALTESGVEALAEHTVSYRTEDQRVHLVLAQTLQEDGKKLPVEDRAVFLESPQHGAGDSVYGDRGQLRIIFSGMRPHVVREVIAVIEDPVPRIPGHFSTGEQWGAYWPQRMARTVVVMPDAIAERVKVTSLGSGVPEVVKEKKDGWQTWIWTKEKLQHMRYEQGRPPLDQTGPAIFVTTVPDWETFGDWYRGLLKERQEIGTELKELSRKWTKGAKSEQEKINAIITHVSRDLRYTGLEFGISSLQPRAPDQVWKTGYGDCKDKSNLAVLLLREAGIEANLVLVQTEHVGRVEKRAPDFRHFDHAILVVKTKDGPVFCDPTIRYGKPGMLSASASDREVLVVKEKTVEWARTPKFPGGDIHYTLDAKVDTNGEMEGWLDLTATGYYQSHYQAFYERLGREELHRDVQETLGDLMPGARVIDVERGDAAAGKIWRCYFALSGNGGESESQADLHFPAGGAVMLYVGEDENRETARFLWPITWRVSGRIALPSGWQAKDVPAALDFQTDIYQVRAAWGVEKGACLPQFTATISSHLLEPKAHGPVWRGTQSLRNWLRKTVTLVPGEDLPIAAPTAAALTDFPLMPTGEGQLTLLERRYPITGNRQARREALRKTMAFFPDDAQTLFSARTKLALIDWEEDKPEEALRQLRQIIAAPSAKIEEETLWWARYMTALVLADTKQPEEAMTLLKEVIERKTLSPYRRAWACFQAGRLLREKDANEEALQFSRDGLALEDLDSTPVLLAQCVFLLFDLKREAELKPLVEKVIETHSGDSAAALVRLAGLVQGYAAEGQSAEAASLLAILESLPAEVQAGEVATAIAQAGQVVKSAGAAAVLQKELQEFLKAHPELEALKAPSEGWPETVQACNEAYAKADKAVDSGLAYRLALHRITAFPADAEFGKGLWHVVAHLEHHERVRKATSLSPLVLFVFELGKRLPRSDDHHYEIRFLQARVHERWDKDWNLAIKCYEEMVADKEMADSFRISAVTRLADCHQALGDWQRTAATLATLESLKGYSSAGDGLTRAAHLRLEMGEPEEALRLMAVVESSRDFLVKNSDLPDTLVEFLDLAKDRELVKKRWQAKPSWWPHWLELQKKLGIEDRKIEPLILNAESLGSLAMQAAQEKDAATVGSILRQVAHGARWQPSRVISMAWLCTFHVPRVHVEERAALLTFVQALLDDFEPANEEQTRGRRMYLTISHMDREDPEAAVEHVHGYFKQFPNDEHALTFVMARLWGSLAMQVKSEQTAAIESLVRTLASKELRSERARSVTILADLYRATGQGDREAALLEAAVIDPAITAETQQVAALKQRLGSLTTGVAYAKAVKRWLSRHAPAWYDFAQPKDLSGLDDEEGLHAKIGSTVNQRNPQENAKVFLLAASQETAQSEEIDEWWARGLSLVLALQAVEESRVKAQIDAALDDADAPDEFKDTALRAACFMACDHGQKALVKHWRAKVPAAKLSDYSRERLPIIDTVLELDLDKPEVVRKAVQEQVKKRDASLLEVLVDGISTQAVRLGKLPALEAVGEVLAAARKDGAIDNSSLQPIRLAVIRSVAEVRRGLPVQEAMAAVILKHRVGQPAKGQAIPNLVGEVAYPQMACRRFMDWMHAQIAGGLRPCGGLHLWAGYLSACAELGPDVTWDLRRQLIDAAAQAATGDEMRAQMVSFAANGVDIDSAEEREYLMKILKPWRDAAALPRTFAEIRLLEARVAERLGQPFEPQTLRQLKVPGIEADVANFNLRKAVLAEDPAGAGAALDAIGEDALFETGDLRFVMAALKLANREAELELAREVAREQVYEAVLQAWTGTDIGAVRRALSLAHALEDGSLLPEEWLKFTHNAYPERHEQVVQAAYVASLKKDWPAALAAANEAVEKFPTFYSNYWMQAEALWELDRKEEALKALRTFTQYCHDELPYPRAMSMLKGAAE